MHKLGNSSSVFLPKLKNISLFYHFCIVHFKLAFFCRLVNLSNAAIATQINSLARDSVPVQNPKVDKRLSVSIDG